MQEIMALSKGFKGGYSEGGQEQSQSMQLHMVRFTPWPSTAPWSAFCRAALHCLTAWPSADVSRGEPAGGRWQ